MYYEFFVAADEVRARTKRAEKKAAENWRFRHLKSKESQILTAIVTNVLGLFLR